MWSLEGQLCRGDSATRRPPPPVKAVRVCSLVCGPVEKTHSITFLTDSPAELTQGTAGSRIWAQPVLRSSKLSSSTNQNSICRELFNEASHRVRTLMVY